MDLSHSLLRSAGVQSSLSHTVALFQHAQHAMTARIPTTQGNSQYSLCCYTLRSLYGILRASCCKECKLVSEPVSRYRCTASDSRCAKVYRTIGPLTFASIPKLPAQHPSRSLLYHSGVPSVAAPSVLQATHGLSSQYLDRGGEERAHCRCMSSCFHENSLVACSSTYAANPAAHL